MTIGDYDGGLDLTEGLLFVKEKKSLDMAIG